MSQHPAPPQTPPHPPIRPRSHWPLALAAIVLILCGSVILSVWLVFTGTQKVVGTAVNQVADAFRPNVQHVTLLSSSINGLKADPKLVVLTTTVDAEIVEERTTTAFWNKIYLGTTTVRIRARENKIQYYVPLVSLNADKFRYKSSKKELVVTVPKPVLDQEMVEVQSDPAKIEIQTSVGWASLDRYEGKAVREQAQRDLRPTVLEQGKKDFLQREAMRNAQNILRKRLLAPLKDALNPEVTLRIDFEGVQDDEHE